MTDQDPIGCNAGLITFYKTSAKNDRYDATYLNLITESTYQELKKSAGGSAGFPIQGVPVEFGATYDDFSARRRDYVHKIGYTVHYDESQVTTSLGIDAEVIKSWLACKMRAAEILLKQLDLESPKPLRSQVAYNDNKICWVVYYIGGIPLQVVSSSVQNGTCLLNPAKPREIFAAGSTLQSGPHFAQFERDKGANLVLTLAALGAVDTLTVESPSTELEQLGVQWYAALDAGLIRVKEFVEKDGGAIDMKIDTERNTPLHRATEINSYQICEYLLSKGADSTAINIHGDSPRSYAATKFPGSKLAMMLLAH